MKFKTQQDVYDYVQLKTKRDPKVIRFVIKNLWDNVRFLLTNPLEIPFNLLLNTFCKFEITDYALERKLENIKKEHLLRVLREIKKIRDGKKEQRKQQTKTG